MLNVVMIEVGNYLGRGRQYVEALQDMVRRNLDSKVRGRIVLLTDSVERYKDLAGVEARLLPPGTPASWWAKMELFNPATFEAGERVLYFDLDTVITGPLDALAAYLGHFGILRDAYRPAGLQSSVMAFETGTKLVQAIWEEYEARAFKGGVTEPNRQWPGGDQQFLEAFWAEYLPLRMQVPPSRVWPPDRLQDQFPGQLRSYKTECAAEVPKGTVVVFFHGDPRPHDCTGWVPEVWKVGAGTAVELVMVSNVPHDQVLRNIVANRFIAGEARELEMSESHELTAVIVGGGPSLKQYLLAISANQRGGAKVLATNATDAYLRAHGITPDAHLVVDAREAMMHTYQPGGKKLYASMVHPGLVRLAAEDPHAQLTLWHPLTDGAAKLIPEGAPCIGGGTTIGVKAMVLAYAMGFRKLLLFGMDSSYEDGAHHAYPQAQNDTDRVLDVITRGKSFKAAPWMVQQAEDFKTTAAQLSAQGCQITVFGEGLIPWIASGMVEAPETPYKQVKGIWWPTSDEETAPAVLGTLPDCRHYAELARGNKVCVQAGGNVGVWAVELAGYFKQVFTFEPDPLNWECLKRNTVKVPTINAYPMALGTLEQMNHRLAIERQVGNCGATRMLQQDGATEVLAIDALNLKACDLIILDVEGFEQFALEGAEMTIHAYSPVIVLELKGLGTQYGHPDESTIAWLAGLGYEVAGRRHRDVIFTKRALQ